ncbi:major facilitator superfamily protein [Sarocladium implicatum]|nr:major facilitator superfamily protein [Sarocladium implicatum]
MNGSEAKQGSDDVQSPNVGSESLLRPDQAAIKPDSVTATPFPDTENVPPSPVNVVETPPPPPDGGYGWVCTACVATINAHTWGLNSSYGVFLAHYLAEDVFPGATPLQYAFVGSLSVSCALGVSPLATIATREIGTKPTMLIGVVAEAASLILAGWATQIWHLFLTQGILFGLGMGFIFVPSVAIVPQWFSTKRSLANGFSACGSGLGGVIYSFAAGAIIENLGLKWAFWILGILAFVVNTACTLLVRDRNKIIGSRQLAFDFELFTRIEYLLLLAFGWFSMLGYIVLIFSLANYANVIGLDASEAALISAIFNLGQGVGRPFVGYFSDRTGRLNMATMLTAVTGVLSLAIWINAHTYGVLIFFAFIGGTVAGTFWAVAGPVTAEVVGLKSVPSALNLMWLVILLPCTFSQPIGMQLIEATGSYLPTQIWTGLMYIVAALCLCIVRGWKMIDNAKQKEATESSGEDVTAPADSSGGTEPVMEATLGQNQHHRKKNMMVECWKWRKV